ncbi:MAG TPA: right-handed parallel beta-helix repeat-containing protein [Desulfuromonadaceae bacterium]
MTISASPRRRFRLLACTVACAMVLPLAGCFRFLFEGEDASRNKRVISVTVPADTIPPAVKPLPEGKAQAPKPAPPSGKPAPPVQERFLPQETPPKSPPMECVPLEPARPAGTNAFDDTPVAPGQRAAVTHGDSSYEDLTITEDMTWRGTVLVRGSLVVAPQATLRIEPGTVVRFMRSPIMQQQPRLVVMGRLQCTGTADKPVLLTSSFVEAARGDWGGVLFLSSEKRNQLENCRIEGADTALEAHFSTIVAKGVTIARSGTGVLLRDCTASLSVAAISACVIGLESHDSELDLREAAVTDNRRGIAAYRSTLVLASVKVGGNDQEGVKGEECRIRFNSCEMEDNGVGALLRGGEGQVFMSRFVRNRDVGLHLAGARVRVQRCLIGENRGDGMRVEDGRGVVWASAFSGNGGHNLVNTGQEEFSAVQNWWGSNDESRIRATVLDASRDPSRGAVIVAPWLAEKPSVLP